MLILIHHSGLYLKIFPRLSTRLILTCYAFPYYVLNFLFPLFNFFLIYLHDEIIAFSRVMVLLILIILVLVLTKTRSFSFYYRLFILTSYWLNLIVLLFPLLCFPLLFLVIFSLLILLFLIPSLFLTSLIWTTLPLCHPLMKEWSSCFSSVKNFISLTILQLTILNILLSVQNYLILLLTFQSFLLLTIPLFLSFFICWVLQIFFDSLMYGLILKSFLNLCIIKFLKNIMSSLSLYDGKSFLLHNWLIFIIWFFFSKLNIRYKLLIFPNPCARNFLPFLWCYLKISLDSSVLAYQFYFTATCFII
jgi:hypothetical protein